MIVKCAVCGENILELDPELVAGGQFRGGDFRNMDGYEYALEFSLEATGNDLVCPLCGWRFVDEKGRVFTKNGPVSAISLREERGEMIFQRSGAPFPNEWNAKAAAGNKKLEDFTVIPVEGGYAIRVPLAG